MTYLATRAAEPQLVTIQPHAPPLWLDRWLKTSVLETDAVEERIREIERETDALNPDDAVRGSAVIATNTRLLAQLRAARRPNGTH